MQVILQNLTKGKNLDGLDDSTVLQLVVSRHLCCADDRDIADDMFPHLFAM